MPKVIMECLYCGDIRKEFIWNVHYNSTRRCSICNDKRIKIKEIPKSKDYYEEANEPIRLEKDSHNGEGINLDEKLSKDMEASTPTWGYWGESD